MKSFSAWKYFCHQKKHTQKNGKINIFRDLKIYDEDPSKMKKKINKSQVENYFVPD